MMIMSCGGANHDDIDNSTTADDSIINNNEQRNNNKTNTFNNCHAFDFLDATRGDMPQTLLSSPTMTQHDEFEIVFFSHADTDDQQHDEQKRNQNGSSTSFHDDDPTNIDDNKNNNLEYYSSSRNYDHQRNDDENNTNTTQNNTMISPRTLNDDYPLTPQRKNSFEQLGTMDLEEWQIRVLQEFGSMTKDTEDGAGLIVVGQDVLIIEEDDDEQQHNNDDGTGIYRGNSILSVPFCDGCFNDEKDDDDNAKDHDSKRGSIAAYRHHKRMNAKKRRRVVLLLLIMMFVIIVSSIAFSSWDLNQRRAPSIGGSRGDDTDVGNEDDNEDGNDATATPSPSPSPQEAEEESGDGGGPTLIDLPGPPLEPKNQVNVTVSVSMTDEGVVDVEVNSTIDVVIPGQHASTAAGVYGDNGQGSDAMAMVESNAANGDSSNNGNNNILKVDLETDFEMNLDLEGMMP